MDDGDAHASAKVMTQKVHPKATFKTNQNTVVSYKNVF
jgi:hypothetical protein